MSVYPKTAVRVLFDSKTARLVVATFAAGVFVAEAPVIAATPAIHALAVPARKTAPAAVDSAWASGYALGRDAIMADAPKGLNSDEAAAFNAGWRAGRDAMLQDDMADELARILAWEDAKTVEAEAFDDLGLSALQWPSLVATISFFIGGILFSNFVLPLILAL